MEPQFVVIAGPSSTELASNIAAGLNSSLVRPDVKVFSDGESKIRLDGVDLNGRTCIIVQSTYPPVDRHLIQALMIAHGCREQGARQIIAVIPYLGYARQDRAFLSGEIVSVDLISRLMIAAGICRLVTVDIHSQRSLSHFAFTVDNLTAIPALALFFQKTGLQHPVAVAPDAGSIERTCQFCDLLKCDMVSLKKSRDRLTGEIKIEDTVQLNLEGRDILLVDDMISSGASIIKASELLKSKGARRIFAICTHALLVDGADDRIKSAGVSEIVATNSIPNDYALVDLAPSIVDALNSSLVVRQGD